MVDFPSGRVEQEYYCERKNMTKGNFIRGSIRNLRGFVNYVYILRILEVGELPTFNVNIVTQDRIVGMNKIAYISVL